MLEESDEIILEEQVTTRQVQEEKHFGDKVVTETREITERIWLSVRKSVLKELLKDATDKVERLRQLGYKPEHIEKIQKTAPELFSFQ